MTTKSKKLKKSHYDTLSHMVANGGKLYRVRGGFWLADHTATDFRNGDWTGPTTSILRDMETLGFIRLSIPLEQIKTLSAARKHIKGAEASLTDLGLEALDSY